MVEEFKEGKWNELIDGKSNILIVEIPAHERRVEGELKVILTKCNSDGKKSSLTGKELFNLIQDGLRLGVLREAEKIKNNF